MLSDEGVGTGVSEAAATEESSADGSNEDSITVGDEGILEAAVNDGDGSADAFAEDGNRIVPVAKRIIKAMHTTSETINAVKR